MGLFLILLFYVEEEHAYPGLLETIVSKSPTYYLDYLQRNKHSPRVVVIGLEEIGVH